MRKHKHQPQFTKTGPGRPDKNAVRYLGRRQHGLFSNIECPPTVLEKAASRRRKYLNVRSNLRNIPL